jgi:hypothetical protein
MYNYSPARAPDPTNTAGGWYADPSGRHQYRYWDGVAWTSSVSDGGVRADDVPVQDRDRSTEPSGRSRGGRRVVGFWTSLPGFLTGIAAVVTAGGTIWLSTKDDPPTPPVVVAAEDLGVNIEDEPVSSPDYSDYTTVTDDYGEIVVDVPAEWSDVNGTPMVLDDGTEIPDVAASPDLTAAMDYGAPLVEVSATDTSVVDVPTAMAELGPTDCTSAGTEDYEDVAFEGQIEYFENCAGTDTIYLLLAAEYKADSERIAIVQAQILSDADVDAVVQALDTFDFVS